MLRTAGGVRPFAYSFLVLIAAQPLVAPEAFATDKLNAARSIATLTPVVNAEILTLSEQNIGGKKFHIAKQTVNASKDQIWTVLTDYQGAAGHFSHLKRSTKINGAKQDGLVGFTAKTGIGPLTVDYVLQIKENIPAGTIEWKRHSGAFKANEGYWQLQPLDDGKRTLVTYAKHIDAGFPIPQSLAHKAVKESMPVIFKDLKSSLVRSNTVAKALTN